MLSGRGDERTGWTVALELAAKAEAYGRWVGTLPGRGDDPAGDRGVSSLAGRRPEIRVAGKRTLRLVMDDEVAAGGRAGARRGSVPIRSGIQRAICV
jgi:hypothetical protein